VPRHNKNQHDKEEESKGDADEFGQPHRLCKSRIQFTNSKMTSKMIACLAFSHFFAPNGLPKLAIVDGGSKMKGVLIAMCKQLGIPCHQAPPEAHDSVLCKRFHRHLNKVQKIGAADAESYKNGG
jgi:hypothetical protein